MTKTISGFTLRELRTMDPMLLRAILREKTHHTLEYPLFQAVFNNERPSPRMGATVRELLEIWSERGLNTDHQDLAWSRDLLTLADRYLQGEDGRVDSPILLPPPNPQDVERLEEIIRARRSIRVWKEEPVPREMVERVIDAGLWAPHACNLQTMRFAVLEGEAGRALMPDGEVNGWQVCILVGQDMRPYEVYTASVPELNRDLDCGAAVQNMLLMAHALGLGAVWLTFSAGQADAMRGTLDLPEFIRLRTYIALGWPAQDTLAPGRLKPHETILTWR